MSQVLLNSFVSRLNNRDPHAIAVLRQLAQRHHQGDRRATAALHRIKACRNSLLVSGWAAVGASDTVFGFALPAPISKVTQGITKGAGHVFSTAGKILEGTGNAGAKVLGKAGHYAAVPFKKVGTHLETGHILPQHSLGVTHAAASTGIKKLPPHIPVPAHK